MSDQHHRAVFRDLAYDVDDMAYGVGEGHPGELGLRRGEYVQVLRRLVGGGERRAEPVARQSTASVRWPRMAIARIVGAQENELL